MGNRFREKVVEEGLEPEVPAVEPEVEAPEGAAAEASEEAAARGGKVAGRVAKVLGGDILADALVLLFLGCVLLLVADRYEVESLSREKQATDERIADLRDHRIQMQKRYQKCVKISQIAEELSETGVGITSGPPYEL